MEYIDRSLENTLSRGLDNRMSVMCIDLLAYPHTRERRALANGLSRSPGTMLCGRLLLRGKIVGLFWLATAIDLRLLGGSFFDAMVVDINGENEKNEWTKQTSDRRGYYKSHCRCHQTIA